MKKDSISINLSEEFLKEEMRSGYLVENKMKEVWAIELDLLNSFIEVCKKYEIQYAVIGGTLLGAARHKGFIPWDDDIDVMVSRKDYKKLCLIAEKEFQYPYFFQTDDTDFGFGRPFARLRNSQTTGIQRTEVGERLPYNQGIFIDIFPYDNIPDDLAEREAFIDKLSSLFHKANRFSRMTIKYKKSNAYGFKGIIKNCIAPILRWIVLKCKIPNFYLKLWEKEVQKYDDTDTNEIGLMYFYKEEEVWIWKSKYIKEYVQMPFEMLSVAVPLNYEEMLTKTYGDWKEFVVGKNIHGDMFFDTNRTYQEYIDKNKIVTLQIKNDLG